MNSQLNEMLMQRSRDLSAVRQDVLGRIYNARKPHVQDYSILLEVERKLARRFISETSDADLRALVDMWLDIYREQRNEINVLNTNHPHHVEMRAYFKCHALNCLVSRRHLSARQSTAIPLLFMVYMEHLRGIRFDLISFKSMKKRLIKIFGDF